MRKRTGPGKTEKRTAPSSLMLYNFDTDWAELKREHEDFLRAEAVPILSKGGSVTLVGLTDRTGSAAHNQNLSEARVASTIVFLRKTIGLVFQVRNDTAAYGEQAAEQEGELDGSEDERFRTVLLFLSETSTPPKPEFPQPRTIDPLLLAKVAYGKWMQFKRALLILPGTKEPTSLRFLNMAEAHQVWRVFGGSLDLTKIFISDALGVGHRPFTAALQADGLGWIVVLNLGSFASWDAPMRRAKVLMHELTHAWQSQHHWEKDRFMSMALACQARAAVSPPHFNSDAAYWYVPAEKSAPPRPFGEYGAEQIAQQVEDDYSGRQPNPVIVSQIASTLTNMVSAVNVSSLLTARWETTNSLDVVK